MRWFTVVAVFVFMLGAQLSAQFVPQRANQYKRALIGTARSVWGLDAPVAVFAAQLHAESGWRPDAKSIYANGLAQFTPATAADISKRYPELADNQPFEPTWALAALARYNRELYLLEPNAATPCERFGFTLSSYNGGRGWVIRQKAATRKAGDDASRWFHHVENHRVRGRAAHYENVTYPRRILLTLQPLYLKAMWGTGIDCEGVR